MTPSSKSEPELETQPAKTGPDDTTVPPLSETPEAPVGGVVTDETTVTEEPVTEDTVKEDTVTEDATTEGAVTEGAATEGAVTEDRVTEDATTPTAIFAEGATEVVAVDDDEEEEDEDDEDDEDDHEVLGSDPGDGYPTIFPLLGALIALTAIAALMLFAFALPAVKSNPHRVPIGVAGSAEINTQLRELFAANGSTAFDVTSFSKESDLTSAIKQREIYGGLSVTDTAITMLISSAASATAADTLNSVANSLSSQAQSQIPVTDVVAMPASDPRGEGLAAANLPLVFASILPALILIPLYRRRIGARLGVIAAGSIVIGIGLAGVLNYVTGSTEGSNFWLLTAGLAFGVLAVSLLLNGLFAVGGRIAFGIGAALLVLLAAPLSGLATGPEWLPTPWGAIGQFLPAGANGTLLRSLAYFDGFGWGRPTLVLAVWALIGLLLLGLATLIETRRDVEEELAAEPELVNA